jgi:soluble lytic murein transglycosylase
LATFLVLALAAGGAAQAGLDQAMTAVRAQDYDTAQAEVRGAAPEVVAIVEWHRLRGGEGSFADYVAFLETYPDWPGLDFLRQRGEKAMPASTPPAEVRAYFADQPPQTGTGALRLAVALRAGGDTEAANGAAVRAWREMTLDAVTESTLLAEFGQALAGHHVARMDAMLWDGQLEQAARMRPRVPEGWRLLHDARVGLRRDTPGVDGLINAVPDNLAGDPGLAWERMEWRARRDRTDGVIELFLDRSITADSLGRPDKWAKRRRVLVRDLMRDGADRQAYLIAAQHHLTSGDDFADLEWLAGYIALQKLDTPAAGLDHFRRFRLAVDSPISLSRAGYWEGRAHEALEQPAAAAAAYGFAAEFQTAFYGQLAAERAGLPMDPRLAGTEQFPDSAEAPFRTSSVYKAGLALYEAGELTLAARFFTHLAESQSRTEIGQMAAALESLDAPYIQLQIGKRAASSGHLLHRAYFPMIPMSVEGRPDVEPELALAIARRESEFNPVVVSPAGARGLMQVMPGTADMMSQRLGLTYRLAALTSDPAYNAQLGTAYLQELRDEFGDATILVAAGYNAGPGRPRRWVQTLGDPRLEEVDAIDWIESVPFTETRNYIMRVTESLAPYRARLAGAPVELTLTEAIEAR